MVAFEKLGRTKVWGEDDPSVCWAACSFCPQVSVTTLPTPAKRRYEQSPSLLSWQFAGEVGFENVLKGRSFSGAV